MSDVAVVGAGLTGLVAAYRLAAAGRRVTVFERYPAPGGLVATFQTGGDRLECFYHHLFATDTDYLALARELGLADSIEWRPSRMGIYSHGRLWDFGTPVSLLRFSPLPPADKIRFALTTLWLNRVSRWRRYEDVSARDWIVRRAGRRVYEIVWGPLLRQKYAEQADRVSMAWLWGKIYLRGRSRSVSGMGERLGYMRGSFGRLVDVLADRCRDLGVELELATPVRRLRSAGGAVEVTTRQGTGTFPAVLFTASPADLVRATSGALPAAEAARLSELESTAAMCGVLELDRPLSPYYWLNIADEGFPFGGVIEHTNYVPPERYGGCRIVYLSKYLFQSHPLWNCLDDEVWKTFLPFLRRINPDFEPDWVRDRHVFRAAHAQPVIPLRYSRLVPPFATGIPGLFHACMAQIYPEDRGQNYAVRAGNRASEAILAAGGRVARTGGAE